MINNKKCLICNKGKKNDVLYWHLDKESGDIWCWCNSCDRGYGLFQYCHLAGISVDEFLKGDFDFKEASPNEVTRMEWPTNFIPLSDPRAKKGTDYIRSRGLEPKGDMFYDTETEAIVFPYYFGNVYVGAQKRLLTPWVKEDGDITKVITVPGTRTGLLIYGYNQDHLMSHVKNIVICEGAFNALSLQAALDAVYGGTAKNPYKCVACSGSGASKHHREIFKDLKDIGYKIICCPDNDEAGIKMFDKYVDSEAITHYALTDDRADWNDKLQELGERGLAKYFLERLKKI